MLKIVPDPPHPHAPSLENCLIQLLKHLACAQTIGQQALMLHDHPEHAPISLALPEIESAPHRVATALSQLSTCH